MIYLSSFLLSFFIALTLIPLLIRSARTANVLDVPDDRKIHTMPIPRVGGIAMAVGVFAPLYLWALRDRFLKAYVIGAAIIVLFGIIDDFKGLPYKVKFLAQVAAALVVIFLGDLSITQLGAILPENITLPPWIATSLTLLVIVGVTNAINLADGLDGLAGGICLLSFCCIGYLAWLENNTLIALLSLSFVGVIFGFLRFNTHPASLFMGDTGSQLLGFSLITVSLALTQGSSTLSPILPFIICGFPILDTLTVMFERAAAGRPIFAPDKNHFHHRLLRIGLFHTDAVFVIYIIQAVLVLSAFFLRFYSEWILLIGYGLFAALILGGFYVAHNVGFTFRRFVIIDSVIKGRFSAMRERGILIKTAFRITEFGIPALLFFTAFLPSSLPPYLAFGSATLIFLIWLVFIFKKAWLHLVLIPAIYLIIPFIVYYSCRGTGTLNGLSTIETIYNCGFVMLVFFVVLTLKFTRRQQGFRATPLDFLIFFTALAAPTIAGMYSEYGQLGNMVAKTIMFYFGFEVLIGELRGSFGKLTIMTLATLLVVVIRGIV
jgi:UDP-GlcNAc:undecaprenyl-phosphate GlcNAc-1-phosphate transferase